MVKHRCLPGLLFTFALFAFVIGGAQPWHGSGAQARQPERGVLFAKCPPRSGVLCQALVQTLATFATQHVIRIGTAPSDGNFTQVTLHLSAQGGQDIAHLSWHAPSGSSGIGPMQRYKGSNLKKSPSEARTFLSAMVAKSPELLSILDPLH